MKLKKAQKDLTKKLIEAQAPTSNISKLDLGCGTRKVGPDWTGVDRMKFDGVDVALDLMAKDGFDDFKPWPWKDNSIDEIYSSHLVEHFEPAERIHFVNEMWRILKPGCKAVIHAPDWSSMRAYGDLTHKWPPISGFWFFYLSEDWRKTQAPHNTEYTCNFGAAWGHALREDVAVRNQEYQMFAMANFKDVCTDIICTLTAIKA